MMVRPVQMADVQEICDIYNYYVSNTVATFEVYMVSEEEMVKRIESAPPGLPWLCALDDNGVSGFAYASPWKSRTAYRYALETTVYVRKDKNGRGIGHLLYNELINNTKKLHYHSLVAGIALPNEASVALHEKCGFKKVAHFREIGFKFDRWIDVGYWELLLH
jgi:phosphinothricin acetyltransferase